MEKCCGKWKIGLKAAKTQASLISKRRKFRPKFNIRVQVVDIPWRDTYLIVELDMTLTWKSHIKKAQTKAKLARFESQNQAGSYQDSHPAPPDIRLSSLGVCNKNALEAFSSCGKHSAESSRGRSMVCRK